MVRVGLLALTLLLTLALSNARRDTTAPEVWGEAKDRVAAGVPFDLQLSANEPVTYFVRYGQLELEQVSQNLTVSLLALPGQNEIQVRARDGAENETQVSYSVEGVEPLSPVLELPLEVEAGEPFTVTASWEETGAALVEATLAIPSSPGNVVPGPGRLTLISVAPLGSGEEVWEVEVMLTDEFGRESIDREELRIIPGGKPVEELNVPASTLSVITPTGRELERQAFERAFAESLPEPAWTDPFVLPIEGRSTSGFGFPRRYAPGGPVSYHQGSDIGAPTGTPVRAANAGLVRIADFFPIKGGLTIIDHGGGVSSLYFHQSEILVTEGEAVSAGQIIGAVGSTGLSTGPHLHWEMRVDGEPSNPMTWVGKIWP